MPRATASRTPGEGAESLGSSPFQVSPEGRDPRSIAGVPCPRPLTVACRSRSLIACSIPVRTFRPFIRSHTGSRGIPPAHSQSSLRVTTERARGTRNGFPPSIGWSNVPFPKANVDIHAVPTDFDELIDWLERWSYNLVLLEEYPLPEVKSALDAVDRAVRAHRTEADRRLRSLHDLSDESSRGRKVVLNDHEWFETSLEQFWWFYRVVEKEDHGGHRQALGQYGRVLGESLRRHRVDENALLKGPSAGPAHRAR